MKLNTYRHCLLLLLLLCCFNAKAQLLSNRTPKREVRAVWLTTIGGLDWPHSYAQSTKSMERQQKELCSILNRLQKAGINTVLLQTRIRATTIYPSSYEPWDGCLSGFPGRSPGYDALAFAIEECHKRGMEVQAWVVTLPVGKWNALGCQRLRKRYPKLVRRIDGEGYLNPESPQTAHYLADLCAEITRNYDIDGIHLDYIRYPETWPAKVNPERGRANITYIAKTIHDRVKALKPWVKMSCSPIGKADDLPRAWSHGWNAYKTVCQDAQGWLQSGLMDELFPMMYFKDDQFFPFAIDWKEQSAGRIIAPGLGIYFLSPKEKNWNLDVITREMEVLRQHDLGHAYFRSRFFTDNVKGIYSFASEDFDYSPALVPPMTWASSSKPGAPTRMSWNKEGNRLSWNGAIDHSGCPYLLYNVYSSRTYPVDITNGNNLIATYQRDTIMSLSRDGRYYAITAIDRYGNESEPLQSEEPKTVGNATSAEFLACDGLLLRLPPKGNVLDANYVIVETLQGAVIATLPYQGHTADVKNIPEGIYWLRSLGRKGRTHRLGMFVVKRKALNPF